MAAIDPFASIRFPSTTTTTPTAPNDQFGKDTFLKLLVAQLRYQNPLAPSDGTEFLTQAAQFTMVEKLQEIEEQAKNQTATNEVLAASSMIGRRVTFALGTSDQPAPVATTEASFGGNLPADADPGTAFNTTVDVYNNDGTPTTLRVEYRRLDTAGNDWEVRTYAGAQPISGPYTLSFDANGERTTPDPQIAAAQLDTITGLTGTWDASGITLDLGSATDPGRLRSTAGSSSLVTREQNGSDGTTITGIVTGVRFDLSGPLLVVGDRELPLTAVMEVEQLTT